MKSLFIALVLALSVNAFADGFKCEQLNHNLKIKVYNNTQPTEGTRKLLSWYYQIHQLLMEKNDCFFLCH